MPKKIKSTLEDVLSTIQTDLASLKKNVLTKEDAKNFATKDDLKNFATKDDLKNFATKDDLKALAKQKDLIEVKKTLNDLYDFVTDAVPNLCDWTDDIHKSIVQEELPKRVKNLEKLFKS